MAVSLAVRVRVLSGLLLLLLLPELALALRHPLLGTLRGVG